MKNNNNNDHNRLVELLLERSVRYGKFILASGEHTDTYMDVRQTTLHAEGSGLVAKLILNKLYPEVVAVGGLTLGADPIAVATATWSESILGRPIHAFLIRKDVKKHGTQQRIEGLANIPIGKPVCIVEDTTTTGISLMEAVEAAEEAGLNVIQCITVVDRERGAHQTIAAQGLFLEELVRLQVLKKEKIR